MQVWNTVDTSSQSWVTAHFNCMRYVSLWQWPFTIWLFDLGITSRGATCVINAYALFEMDTTYISKVTTTTIFYWPLIFTFFLGGGAHFKCRLFNPLKALLWPKWRIMTYCSGGASKDATFGRVEETERLSFVKLAICPDHPRRHGHWNFACGVVTGRVIYFKFRENRLKVSELCEVENRHLLLTWPIAYSTACTLSQKTIRLTHVDNFAKYEPIFSILSVLDSTQIFLQNNIYISHHTLKTLLL